MALNNRTKLGVTLAIAVLAGLTSGLAGTLVLVLAWLLIAWGQAPQRTEAFLERVPGGNYLLKALARIDLIFWPPGSRERNSVQAVQGDVAQANLVAEKREERENSGHLDLEHGDLPPEDLAQAGLGQEDSAHEDFDQVDLAQENEGNLAREEYFRDILRGYSPEARRRLRQLSITEDPRSVLDEEWVQYFRDGLVETTHSGRGAVRPELKELIGRLLDEFQDGP
jgi:hypothetical protein